MIRLSELHITLSPDFSIDIPPLNLNKASVYLLLGDSGCGKSTLLKCLGGFIPESHIQGTLSSLKTALLLQNPMHQMITATVASELAFPLIQQGLTPETIRARVEETAAYFGLNSLMDEKLYDLSFGELQTVMVATTLLIPADLYLLDEPTSHLDHPMIDKMYRRIRSLLQKSGATCLIASQYPDEYIYSDRVLVFRQHVLQENLPAESYPSIADHSPDIPGLTRTEIHEILQRL